MTDRYDSSYYEELQGQVRGVVIEVEQWLTKGQLELLNELIDANEPGVALEMVSDLLMESEAMLPRSTKESIGRLVATMELPAMVADQLESRTIQ